MLWFGSNVLKSNDRLKGASCCRVGPGEKRWLRKYAVQMCSGCSVSDGRDGGHGSASSVFGLCRARTTMMVSCCRKLVAYRFLRLSALL